MATLLLSTSCAPLKKRSSPSHGNSATVDHRSSATSDYWSNVGSSDGKNGCGTTEQSAANLDTTSLLLDGGHSCQHHHDSSLSSIVNSHPQAKNSGDRSHVENGPQQQGRGQGIEFLDKLRALPVQCDITIVPRAHPTDLSANSSSLNTNDTNDSSIGDGGGGEDGGVMQPVRITKQHFHPCGMDNIVRLATGSSSVTSFDFILSLANCGVRVGSRNENGEEVMRLPVQAVPSSFSIPSSHSTVEGEDDSMGRYVHGDKPYSHSRGAKRNVEEVAVSFDFSMAVNVYQQHLDEISAAAEKLTHSKLVLDDARVKKNQSWNADGTTTILKERTVQDLSTVNVVKNSEIQSIMSTLEEESQFIKKTLFVLGSFGFGLLICMVWTIYKLERGRSARRRVHVRRVLVDNVPCEIIGTTSANNTTMTNNTAATTKSRGPGVTSSLQSHPSLLRSHNDNGRAHHFPEEISPIRSSSVSLDEAEDEEVEQADDVVAVNVSETKKKKAVHETLHLITPHDVVTVTGSSTSNTDEGQRSSSSPRHWYEDFLSPKGCSKKAPRSNRTDDDALLSEHEEVARSLFRSSSSSSSDCNKESPPMDNKDSVDTSKGTTSSSSILNAPKKKVLVTPIESSLLMTPLPSDTSLLKLSKDIESTKSPLMISTETEGTHESCTATGRELDEEPQTSIEVIDKEEHCTISPTSTASNEESSSTSMDATSTAAKDESTETITPSLTPINTPKPKSSSRTLKTPATDISIGSSSQGSSQASAASLRARKIFAQELTKKAWLTPPNTQKTNFSTSIARRAAEVQTSKKTLTPLSASSSLCGDDEPSPFLADYW